MIIQLDEAKRTLLEMKDKIKDLGSALQIDELKNSVSELEKMTSAENFWNDVGNSGKILKEIKIKKDKIDKYEQLKSRLEDAIVLVEMGIEEDDESVTDEALSEVKDIVDEESRQRIEVLLSGEYDQNNAILSFHPGAGGTEAQDWAQMLYRMYVRWGERHNYNVKLIDWLDGDEAGIKSATILVEGTNAYGYLKSETEFTVLSACLRLMRQEDGIPLSLPWKLCLNLMMRMEKLSFETKTWKLLRTVRAALEVSI